jgi:hypothetical protein
VAGRASGFDRWLPLGLEIPVLGQADKERIKRARLDVRGAGQLIAI